MNGYKHEKILKQLFHEVMINITEDGPKSNFIAYDKVWYRDAAIIAMVLEKTNNVKQIEQWINSITEIYDMQNGEKEADNLGQVLYLVSLVENKNEQLINKIKQEANKIKEESKEKIKQIVVNLLDVLDDETIALKVNISVEEVKQIRANSSIK